jgi:hypothetical protein
VETQKGPVIAIFHQYALFEKGTTIHSPEQFEFYQNDVNDKSIHVGGLQQIKTLEGYTIPLNIKNGLARMALCPYTVEEWDMPPHVFLTNELEWDPSVLDHALTDDEQWYDAISDLEADPTTNLFNEYGNYRKHVTVQYVNGNFCTQINENDVTVATNADSPLDNENPTDDEIPADEPTVTSTSTPRDVTKKDPDFKSLRPLFEWLLADIIMRHF